MNIKEAKNIAKSFIKNEEKFSPVLTSDWQFKIINKKVYLSSDILNISTYLSTIENYAIYYAFNEDFDIHNNKVFGNYYFTSVGLISEEKYFEALDYIELFDNPIKKKDLVEGSIYLSDRNKKYVYVEEIKKIILHPKYSEFILKKEIKIYKDLLFDLEKETLVKLSSIKLIKDLDLKLDYPILKDITYDTYYINSIDEAIYENYSSNLNSSLWFHEYNSIKSNIKFNNMYYDSEEIDKFIYSDNLELELYPISDEIISPLQRRLTKVSNKLSFKFKNYNLILEDVEENIINISYSDGFISRRVSDDELEKYLTAFFTEIFKNHELIVNKGIFSHSGLYVILSLLDKYDLSFDLFRVIYSYEWSRLDLGIDNPEESLHKIETFNLS